MSTTDFRHVRDHSAEARALTRQAIDRYGHKFGWPYGPNINLDARYRMLDWAADRGVRPAYPRHPCLHWLAKGRCMVAGCHGIAGDRLNTAWGDHVSVWLGPERGQRLLVSQPYLSADVARRAVPDGFRAVVHESSWYGLGTCLIELWTPSLTEGK